MKNTKHQFQSWLEQRTDTFAVAAYHNETPFRLLTDRFDLLLLVVTFAENDHHHLFHYIKDGLRVQEIRMSKQTLEQTIGRGDSRKLMQWLIDGEIWLDRESYLSEWKHQLNTFAPSLRARKLLMEFSHFVTSFLQSKEYVREDHLLDAYNMILEALHHWARIVIIEAGLHPEVMVWKQVRMVNPGIYKLYEELTQSSETLRQRIELVQLACDFSVMSKAEQCSSLLLQTIASRKEPWSIEELHACLDDQGIHLSLLLSKLVRKSLVREVPVSFNGDYEIMEIRYTI